MAENFEELWHIPEDLEDWAHVQPVPTIRDIPQPRNMTNSSEMEFCYNQCNKTLGDSNFSTH